MMQEDPEFIDKAEASLDFTEMAHLNPYVSHQELTLGETKEMSSVDMLRNMTYFRNMMEAETYWIIAPRRMSSGE